VVGQGSRCPRGALGSDGDRAAAAWDTDAKEPGDLGRLWNARWNAGDFDPINEEIRQQTIDDSPAAVRDERDRVFRKLVEVVSRFSDDDLARPANDFGLEEEGKSLLAVLTEYHGDHFEEHRGYIEIIVAQG